VIVVTGEYGQLGNRLIVYANMLAAAREHGLRVTNPAFHPYARYFETGAVGRCRPLVARAALATARWARKVHNRTQRWPGGVRVLDIGWHDRCDLDAPQFLEAARTSRMLLAKGWRFRAAQSFQRHADTIRATFSPRAEHRRNIAAVVSALRRTCTPLVGVHIRRGDYRAFLGGRYFYEVSAYAGLIGRLRDAFGPRTGFLVCSHEPDVCAALPRSNVQSGPGHEVEDLYALASCDYIIGPPSTYTMWASFHGRAPLHVWVDPNTCPAPDDFGVIQSFERTSEHYAGDRPVLQSHRTGGSPGTFCEPAPLP
jgi:hypothetical protein